MENAPVVRMSFVNGTPGVDTEAYERFIKWVGEVLHTDDVEKHRDIRS